MSHTKPAPEKSGDDPIDKIRALVKRDGRYPVKAYLFIFEALNYTLDAIGEKRHVSGQELCHGIREKAIGSFGPLASCVFRQWGIAKTDDFGEIVFRLIEMGLMDKTDQDTRDDFCDVFDLAFALDEVELELVVC